VRQHERVVVDVDDLGIRGDALAVGSPVPTSRNCRIPISPARKVSERRRNARVSRAMTVISGWMASQASPASRSTA
jgi:hypothetical protein